MTCSRTSSNVMTTPSHSRNVVLRILTLTPGAQHRRPPLAVVMAVWYAGRIVTLLNVADKPAVPRKGRLSRRGWRGRRRKGAGAWRSCAGGEHVIWGRSNYCFTPSPEAHGFGARIPQLDLTLVEPTACFGHDQPTLPTVKRMTEPHKRANRYPKYETAYRVKNWAEYDKAWAITLTRSPCATSCVAITSTPPQSVTKAA
jgi:hypothetical protein